ncbi:hypothetical protein AALB_4290 [Agarivorans albus MKT 106]|uniref:Uncharacterized protein n=1 Tax=Agarivorans albus MKT 106 TaxID=1331007 RepID=R9PSD6_AGAAL|nr:hypothetical protein AALB_4290 [Agarivorans albus MKT 106]
MAGAIGLSRAKDQAQPGLKQIKKTRQHRFTLSLCYYRLFLVVIA